MVLLPARSALPARVSGNSNVGGHSGLTDGYYRRTPSTARCPSAWLCMVTSTRCCPAHGMHSVQLSHTGYLHCSLGMSRCACSLASCQYFVVAVIHERTGRGLILNPKWQGDFAGKCYGRAVIYFGALALKSADYLAAWTLMGRYVEMKNQTRRSKFPRRAVDQLSRLSGLVRPRPVRDLSRCPTTPSTANRAAHAPLRHTHVGALPHTPCMQGNCGCGGLGMQSTILPSALAKTERVHLAESVRWTLRRLYGSLHF
jgi:hypothetical protein